MRQDIYNAIQKALYEHGELVASRMAIEVIATVVADMAIREERERCARVVEEASLHSCPYGCPIMGIAQMIRESQIV